MERVVERSNAKAALRRVKQNKGSPGSDGMTVEELTPYLVEHWQEVREQLLAGTHQPRPVKRQPIPKSGGGVRELGIPCVLDRMIQQAVLQVLQPIFDPTFSEHSYGFRPGRRAHDAVCAAQRYIQSGRRWVVDVDLEKFFDRVNHDVLMGKLANVLLDEVDKELEKRGHTFARYADDCNVYVQSRRAGERVMQALRRLYARLRLRVNESKSAVARPWGRKFLGYSFWVASGKEVKRRVASQALVAMKERIRSITRRNGGRSIESVSMELRGYLVGWREYFRLADTPRVFRELDEWIRHRLRAIQLKHWKRGTTIYRELRARGLSEDAARKVAGNARRRWKNAGMAINIALPTSLYNRLGVPRLAR
jgi:retron-type reverse transcriptase